MLSAQTGLTQPLLLVFADCGGVLPETGGVIRAPLTSSFNYTHRTLCHWTYDNPDSASTAVFKAPKVINIRAIRVSGLTRHLPSGNERANGFLSSNVLGSVKRWSPGCVNAAGILRLMY